MILKSIITYRSSTIQSRLLLAITFEILASYRNLVKYCASECADLHPRTKPIIAASYRNLVKYCASECGSPSKNKTYYIVDMIFKSIINQTSSTRLNPLEFKSRLFLAIFSVEHQLTSKSRMDRATRSVRPSLVLHCLPCVLSRKCANILI
jgi:hypothetical protein